MEISYDIENIDKVNYHVRNGYSKNGEDKLPSVMDQGTIMPFNNGNADLHSEQYFPHVDENEGLFLERLIEENTRVTSTQTQRCEFSLFGALMISLCVSLISLSFVVAFIVYSKISEAYKAKSATEHKRLIGDFNHRTDITGDWHGTQRNCPSLEMEHAQVSDGLDIEPNSFRSHASAFLNDTTYTDWHSNPIGSEALFSENSSIFHFTGEGDEGDFI
mmetsp:Transcript_29036/g.78576  ORF Transcript_29036/g.78576 Transcript_29036/m.78576 type:complete len:218 (-) Transcript_29036:505-1158(-)